MTKVLEQVHQPPPGTGRLERDRCLRWELRDEPLQTARPVGESILSDLALFDEIGTAQAAGYGRGASRPPRPFGDGDRLHRRRRPRLLDPRIRRGWLCLPPAG